MRGEEYYDTDTVSELEETLPGEWTATVEGTDDYNVEISMNDYAERKMGRRNYEFIAQVLPCIHKLKGGQTAVKNIVAEFRIKYKRRPAMMEVLEKF